MPSYRGITLCMVSAEDSKVYPEFPHPDGSQFQYVSSSTPSDQKTTNRSTKPRDTTPTLNGSNPPVSVYVPSLPGTRFFVRYSINPPHRDGRNFYFKMFMNGRHITSWGMDPRTMPVGLAMIGIFEANKKLKSKTLIRDSAETKAFYFDEQIRNVTAAENGGIIEIRVFRACGKRRRNVTLDAPREQNRYGIEFKSTGLLEKSKYKFFDWLLEDAKDKPYVIFRFHYRSWDSLETLQLIPEMCSRELLPALSTKYGFGISDPSRDKYGLKAPQLITRSSVTATNGIADDPDNTICPNAELATKGIQNTIFGQMIAMVTATSDDRVEDTEMDRSQSNIIEKLPKKNQIPTSSFSTSNNTPISWINSQEEIRPLPELPTGKSLSRQSSAVSSACSIAPSLRSWADNDRSESPAAVLGIAAAVQIVYSPKRNHHGRKKSISDDDSSISSNGAYSDSRKETTHSFQYPFPAPPTYSANTCPIKNSAPLDLTLPTGAVFPPPAMRRARMRRIRFQDESCDLSLPGRGCETSHEGIYPYRDSGHEINTRSLPNTKAWQTPPQLLAINASFNFKFDSPYMDKEGSEIEQHELVGTQEGSVDYADKAFTARNGLSDNGVGRYNPAKTEDDGKSH